MKRNMHAIRRFFATTLAVFAALYVVAHCSGCSAAQNHVVAQDALSASQILCVLASNLTDDATVALACDIDKVLVPLVRPFLAAKEDVAVKARRVRQCADAGASAPTSASP